VQDNRRVARRHGESNLNSRFTRPVQAPAPPRRHRLGMGSEVRVALNGFGRIGRQVLRQITTQRRRDRRRINNSRGTPAPASHPGEVRPPWQAPNVPARNRANRTSRRGALSRSPQTFAPQPQRIDGHPDHAAIEAERARAPARPEPLPVAVTHGRSAVGTPGQDASQPRSSTGVPSTAWRLPRTSSSSGMTGSAAWPSSTSTPSGDGRAVMPCRANTSRSSSACLAVSR
jgi:hypothetical protein